jgi:hypothetical protein
MAQEQWEKEGKIGTIYDRDFRLLNTEEISSPPPELQKAEEERRGSAVKTTVLNTWPLHTPPLGSPRSGNSRPGTSGTDHGGYKMMPTILSTPPIGTPVSTPKPINQPIRVQDTPEENVKEKKGCGACCIVM